MKNYTAVQKRKLVKLTEELSVTVLTDERLDEAVNTFVTTFDELTPQNTDAMYEWLKFSIENTVRAIEDSPEDDEGMEHIALLRVFTMMYVACHGTHSGLARLLLSCVDETGSSNHTHERLLMFVIVFLAPHFL